MCEKSTTKCLLPNYSFSELTLFWERYSPGGSGASTSDISFALKNYFFYDDGVHTEFRSTYTVEEWGGNCDGSFLLTVLNPWDNPGLTDGAAVDSCSYGCSAVVGAQPPLGQPNAPEVKMLE